MVVSNNPYGNGQSNNPWGRTNGLDQQRSDLWTLDLAEATATTTNGEVLTLPTVLGCAKVTLRFHPESVSLPDQGIGADAIQTRTGTPYPYPGQDEQTPVVRIVFRHEAASSSTQGKATGHLSLSDILGSLSPQSILGTLFGSKVSFGGQVPGGSLIYGVLEGWKNLARAGRTPYGNESVPLLPSSNGYKPIYRFNVPLRFYGGMDDSSELIQTMGYRMVNAWVRSVQISELNYGNANGVVTVAAQFACDYIEPSTDKVASVSNPNNPLTALKNAFGGLF